MARVFGAVSTDNLTCANLASGYPYWISLWQYPTQSVAFNTYFTTNGVSGSADNFDALTLDFSGGGKVAAATSNASGAVVEGITAASAVQNAWNQMIGQWVSNASRTPALNGTVGGTSGSTSVASGYNQFRISGEPNNHGGTFVSGPLAHVAFGTGTLTAIEQAYLGAGGHPSGIKSCTNYWRLNQGNSPETADIGSVSLTVNGTTFSNTNMPTVASAFVGASIADQTWQATVPITPVAVAGLAQDVSSAFTAQIYQVAASASVTTTASASVSAARVLALNSTTGMAAGGYLQAAGSTVGRILYISGLTVLVDQDQTATAGSTVISYFPCAAATGLGTVSASSGSMTGTPATQQATTGGYRVRYINNANSALFCDSNPFSITITAPPVAGAASIGVSSSAALTTQILAAGAANAGVAAVGALTNWATVTLTSPQVTLAGTINDPNFWVSSKPTVGTTLYYDATNITIYANGEISSTVQNCSAVVQFFDGTTWQVGIIIFTAQIVSYAQALVAAAGALTTGIKLGGAALATASGAGGNLMTGVALAGNALATVAAATALITQIRLNAAAFAAVTAAGALTGGAASLQGAASSLSQALAALTTQVQLAGQALVASTVAGAPSTQILLNGVATALAQANASLLTAINLAGNPAIVSTAAGAALLTSSFAGAAAALTAATGDIQTGILLGGNALVASSAGGTLTTGVGLSGAAEVDLAAALTPTGPGVKFGFATLNVLSPTGFPVAEPTFNAGTSVSITISYFNLNGLPFVPNTVTYEVLDVNSGVVLVPQTAITAELSNAVTVPGTANQMINLARASEEHEIVFEITDGYGDSYVETAPWQVLAVSRAS